jgi:hypothetical protein
MVPDQRNSESVWALKIDILSARVLVWVASAGREAELTPGAHAYFCDRYRRLAGYYRRRGRANAAAAAETKALEHCQDDGPPFAAAMAMPRPTRWVKTWAVSGTDDPDDAA